MTVTLPRLLTRYVYCTSTQSCVPNVVTQSVPGGGCPVLHVRTPRFGSFRTINVHNGEHGPLVPVGLSGLEASRQIGWHTRRLHGGFIVHEQLVCSTSLTPLIVTVVVEPSLDWAWAVASMLKPFSVVLVRMSPVFRPPVSV